MTVRRILHRVVYPASLAAAGAAAVWEYRRAEPAHPHMAYLTGWALLALVLFLTAYNARKKLAFLPLLSSQTWLRAHSWIGMLAALVFVMHLRGRVPTGAFEGVLAALFLGVTLSGIAGWWLSRVLPRRLSSAGGEVPYERIPVILRDLRQRAEALVVSGIPSAGATTLADFYAARLRGFFAGSANLGPHLSAQRAPSTRFSRTSGAWSATSTPAKERRPRISRPSCARRTRSTSTGRRSSC